MVSTKKGFTLIELLVVVGIMAVLTALLVPVITRARRVAADNAIVTAITRTCEGFANDTATNLKQASASGAASYYADLAAAETNYIGDLQSSSAGTGGFGTRVALRNATKVGSADIAANHFIKCEVDRAGVVNYIDAGSTTPTFQHN